MDVRLTVDRLAVGGNGIAREPDGRVVFVEGALPGETVRAKVVSRGRDFWRAQALEIVESSPNRVEPPCPYVAAGCGGCGWQFVDPAVQLHWKADMVRDALARQGRLSGATVTVGASVSPLGYRTTVRLGVGRDGALGLRRAASHELVEIDECLVAHPGLSDLFGRVRLSGADEAVFRVSESTGERTAMAVSASGLTARFEGLPDDVKVGAAATLHETVAGRVLRVSAASFFQSCAHSAELLVDAVRRAAGDTSSVRSWADLYAGVGLFASTLLDDVPVTAVELSASSCADARANLVDRRASIVECDVDRWAPEPVDLVVADPSRSGLGRRAVEVAVATGASTLVLVSCDAASLGRDTALLAAAGFSHVGSEVLDLFPGTPHVEVVTRFERSAC